MKNDSKYSRREFMKRFTAATVAAGTLPAAAEGAMESILLRAQQKSPAANSRVQLATIGMGIIGFIDTETALRVPGVELAAAADVYDGRLTRTREVFGDHVFTTRDYREILNRPDIDAVIVAVPDHWHAKIAADAMKAGKAVYCEKPMVQDIEEGPEVIKVQKDTGQVFQVGSQFVSSMVYDKAKELYQSGAIGELNMVEASYNRNSAIGAWQYSIAPDASPETIDWDAFLGNAPKRDFDPLRFFRWRNYWDYGTGVAGDLYVHLFTAIHHVLNSHGPNRIISTGGLRFWKDGRDVPDVMMALVDYPESENHAPFTLSLQTNFADGSGGGSQFRFIGSEGVITVSNRGLQLDRSPRRRPPDNSVFDGYNSVRTFSSEVKEEFIKQYQQEFPTPDTSGLSESKEYKSPPGYDARFYHFSSFFDSIRSGAPLIEDAVFGYRAAAPALICNLSYRDQEIYHWNPEAMEIESKK